MTAEVTVSLAPPLRTLSVPWGGIMETLYTDCRESENLPKKIRILKRKLDRLEASKTLKDIQHALHFTEKERNYLNSHLLDEIFETIFCDNMFLSACKKGKLNALKFYMERTPFKNKNKGLLKAVSASQKNIIEFLIKDKDITQETKNVALETCCVSRKEILELFLQNGADVHIGLDRPIYLASMVGSLENVELLLDYGAYAEYGVEAAYNNGHVKVLRVLLKTCSNPRIKMDAYTTACKKGYLDIVKFLVEEEKIDIYSEYNLWGIRSAIQNNHENIIEYLVKDPPYNHEADPDLFPWCAMNNYRLGLDLLLKHGADPHMQDDAALKRAAARGHIEIVKILVKDVPKMNPSAESLSGRPSRTNLDHALRMAMEYNQQEVIEFLSQNGASAQ